MRIGSLEIKRTPKTEVVSFDEVIRSNDIVSVAPTHVVVAPRQLAEPSRAELGSTGRTNYGYLGGDEYNPELRGSTGLVVYDKMRRSDAQVRSSLRLLKTPIFAGRWYMDPGIPDNKRAQKIADQVWWNLNNMTMSFQQFLSESLLMLDYGFYAFEKVWDIQDGLAVWRKFAPRHPLDIRKFVYDGNGGPVGVLMREPDGYGDIKIPIEKMLVFTFDREAGNMEGISMLRSAYKHWYYKENLYKIDAIQKERHGIGIPIIKLPPNFSASDKIIADELGRNLRTNEKAHVVLPPMWDIIFAKLEGNPVDAMDSIAHHDLMIARNILAPFINDTSANAQEEQQQFFLKSTRFIAEIIKDTINNYAIPEWMRYNYPTVDEMPQLKVRRIGDSTDYRQLSFALRNMIGSGVIRPDDKLEAFIRNEMDLPFADVETIREVEAKQTGGVARQAPARNMQQAQTPGGNNNGRDGGSSS